MPCTTVLVGRKASNDGSTMIARTDDGHFGVKKMIVTEPKKQPDVNCKTWCKFKRGRCKLHLSELRRQLNCRASKDGLRHSMWCVHNTIAP